MDQLIAVAVVLIEWSVALLVAPVPVWLILVLWIARDFLNGYIARSLHREIRELRLELSRTAK